MACDSLYSFASQEGSCLLQRGIDFGLDPALVDKHTMHTASIIQIWLPIFASELNHCMQAGGRRVLQDHITRRRSPKLEAAFLGQIKGVNDLTILHCLQLEVSPATPKIL